MWSDVHSVKRALLTLSHRVTEEELKLKKEELVQREKDGRLFTLFLKSPIVCLSLVY